MLAGRPSCFDDPCPIFAQGQFGLTMAPKLPKPSPRRRHDDDAAATAT